jgi:hypothetical protein
MPNTVRWDSIGAPLEETTMQSRIYWELLGWSRIYGEKNILGAPLE